MLLIKKIFQKNEFHHGTSRAVPRVRPDKIGALNMPVDSNPPKKADATPEDALLPTSAKPDGNPGKALLPTAAKPDANPEDALLPTAAKPDSDPESALLPTAARADAPPEDALLPTSARKGKPDAAPEDALLPTKTWAMAATCPKMKQRSSVQQEEWIAWIARTLLRGFSKS